MLALAWQGILWLFQIALPWILENTPTMVKFATQMLPLIAFILKKLPTDKTDNLEQKCRTTHEDFQGLTVEDIASKGRRLGWTGSPKSLQSASDSILTDRKS